MPKPIVVLGAGVSGLTCALLLSRSERNAVTVVAKHMPGDYDIEYTSPWAGANVLPMSLEGDNHYEHRTWLVLKGLAEEVPEAGIHFQPARVYRREKDVPAEPGSNFFDALFIKDPWFKHIFPNFRELNPDEVPRGHDSGCEFTSVCINTAIYLPWLVGQCLKNGVVFRRAALSHIKDARAMSHTGELAGVVINASGLGALTLGGVEDGDMAPARGQIVLVRNEVAHMVATSGTEDGGTEVCYVMQRAAGGGTILGGTYDKGNWEPEPQADIAERIMKRAVEVCPSLTDGKGIEALDVVRHGVGLRPYRKGGVRVEKESICCGDEEKPEDYVEVIHNYGHAGWGYQGSYGCAEEVVELVNGHRSL